MTHDKTLPGERAPLVRGPHLLRKRASELLTSPRVRVWAPVGFKALGLCSVLACVAWLGEHSRDDSIYGTGRPLAAPSVPAASDVRGRAGLTGPEVPLACPVPPPCQSGPDQKGTVSSTAAILPDGRLILNEATAEDLDRLPGIGRKRAEDIIQLRGRVGRFRRLTDLLRVRGIGVKSLGKLKEHLLLDRPVEATSEKTPATDVKAQQSAKPEQPVGPASTSQSVGSPL